jgi:hypothetical protein
VCVQTRKIISQHLGNVKVFALVKETKFLSKIYKVFIVQAYQTSQYVVPCGRIFLGKWRSYFAGYSGSKKNVQSACALNTRYIHNNCILLLIIKFMLKAERQCGCPQAE